MSSIFTYVQLRTFELLLCQIVILSGILYCWLLILSTCIFPLTDKGYKIPNLFAVSRVSYVLNKEGAFTLYRLKNTDDYYSFCSINQSGDCDLQAYNANGDALDVDIYRVESGFYYFYVYDFSGGSYLEANGERVLFSGG